MQLNGKNLLVDMVNLEIQKKNEVYLKISAEPHVYQELSDHFTFEVPGAKFMPQYRSKYWDGKIRLFSTHTGEIYVGLLDKVISFCKQYDYDYKFVDNKFFGTPFEVNEMISKEGVKDYMTKIACHKPREYQVEGVYDALRHNRRLLISPTASGKSLMVYALSRYHTDYNRKILVVVPTTSLVEQMYKDFEEYGWDPETYCHKIYSGKEKESNKAITITTWQSVYKLERKWFEKFDVVIGDEAHLFKSKSLINIMTKMHTAKYRYGFTGTLDGTQTHKWVLEGLFGPSYKIIRTEELMRKGHVSKLDINCIILKHDPQIFETYEDEVQYIITHERRNNFIKNLTVDLDGNTLVLFNRVESHGQPLFELINSSVKENRKVFYVHGGVNSLEREKVREIVDIENNAIIVASYGTFSTGINIKNLHNVIFASPSKSRIRNLQSIGRVLRKGTNKDKAVLYDISDDCTKGSRKNYTLNHLIERIRIYNEENFNYDIISVNLSK
jgi:superfamily II DNA or RNA helicase